jgi:hypothetical protein
MTRAMTLFILVVAMIGSSVSVAAQPAGTISYGAGTAADEATVTGVVAFVENFVERMNANDPTIVNVANETGLGFFLTDSYNEALSNVESGMFVEIVLYDIVDVLVHDDGIVSVQVYFSGYTSGWQTTLQTERWYLIPDDGGSFILSDFSIEPLVSMPDSLTSSSVTLTLINDGLELGVTEVTVANVILFEVTNVEANFTGAGIYALADGTTIQDLQATLAAEPFGGEGYIGKIRMFPGPNESMFAFLMEPGTYVVQQFVLDDTGNVASVPQGDVRGLILMVVGE